MAGYEGEPLFTPEAYEEIARFTAGIPRNVNNFCFNALSLACALREKPVNMNVVKEVMADLDISRLVSSPPEEEYVAHASEPRAERSALAPTVASKQAPQTLSPAEAKAYMQQLALKLKSRQKAVGNTSESALESQHLSTRNDGPES